MCGRYVRWTDQQDLVKHFNLVDGRDYFDIHGYKASAEVFPGGPILAVNNENRPEDIWWTIEDTDYSGTMRRTINAKAETVSKAAMFRDAFFHDRVLIPATGFFEWDCTKQKHLFTFDEPIFAFGGIARDCQIGGEIKRCGVIVTTEANDVVRPIHTKGRMPVVIHKYDYARWLDPETPFSELRQMMHPLPNEETHAQPIAAAPSPSNEKPEAKKRPAEQASLFDL